MVLRILLSFFQSESHLLIQYWRFCVQYPVFVTVYCSINIMLNNECYRILYLLHIYPACTVYAQNMCIWHHLMHNLEPDGQVPWYSRRMPQWRKAISRAVPDISKWPKEQPPTGNSTIYYSSQATTVSERTIFFFPSNIIETQ